MEALIETLTAALDGGSWLAVAVAYLAGILVSFTPCTYPVLPVTTAYLGGTGALPVRARAFRTVAYAGGLAVAYTTLGLASAWTGALFGRFQSGFWPQFLLGNLFCLMGLAHLGVFHLRLPAFLAAAQGKAAWATSAPFAVGAASALALGPCTAPALAALLGYAAFAASPLKAVLVLFAFSLGLTTLLVLVGLFAGLIADRPKPGPWMERMQRFCGWVLLAAGEYYLILAGAAWLE